MQGILWKCTGYPTTDYINFFMLGEDAIVVISDATCPPDPTTTPPVAKNPPTFETVIESDSYLTTQCLL